MAGSYRVAVVGIGMVGQEMLKVLHQRAFPASEIQVMATRARTETIDGRDYEVIPASEDAFEDVDIALFAGTEGAAGASRQFGWAAVERGCLVIDNGGDFRMDERVPLVVPEVNADAMREHEGFIANPNCSTIQMVVVLKPLHEEAGLKRVVVSTYQAVSGTGRAAVAELERGVRAYVKGEAFCPEVYPHPIAFNCLPHIGSLRDELPGYTSEEAKMVFETRKIMGLPGLRVASTCVRVPVFNSHCEAANIEFERPITVESAREILADAPGVVVQDDFAGNLYPLPIEASGEDPVYVGRIRRDPSVDNGLDLWVVADNIRKGAALNAVQIAETAIDMGLVS
ncbi:MAG: aspartate-semialdehyde dehydrogenase [Planctomycetota bacterium]